jgi:hypothetical protein
MKHQESGLEELMRLSQRFKKQEQDNTRREKQRQEKQKKVQDVLGGLRGINISMAVEQLKPVAAPEIIRQVNSLKSQPKTAGLRKLITSLAYDLEKRIGRMPAADPEVKRLERTMKTLTILMELYFSLQ